MRPKRTLLIALGGNSILRNKEKGTVEEQYANLERTCDQLVEALANESRIVITHGNGPQVGNLLLAMELAKDVVPSMSLSLCGASTQGYIGYMIQQTLANSLRRAGLKHNITTVITQVIVDKNDAAFKKPSKPVGPFYDSEQAEKFILERGWRMVEDSARGYRRVVASPRPSKIQQARIIRSMLDAGEIVIAAGGGGIPVVRETDGSLQGVEAVIDKDYTSSRLALEIDADVLLFLTAVEKVFYNFVLPSQKALDRLDTIEAKGLLQKGEFGMGSMEPKISALICFLEDKYKSSQLSSMPREREAIITLPEKANEALQGKAGTHIIR